MRKTFYTRNEREVSIDIPNPSNFPSFFVFALHKSGSVLQNNIFSDLCTELDLPVVNLSRALFQQGIEENSLEPDICSLFAPVGYCFLGFRTLPSYFRNCDLSPFKKSLLIRDPRDIVVSHYFSVKKSHGIPPGKVGEKLLEKRNKLQEMEIDEYVLEQAPIFQKRIKEYDFLKDSHFKLFRYEDVVFNKRQWILDILNFLELSLEESVIDKIAKKHDIFPQTENPDSHIRKVTPGDYKSKLKPSTIEALNECFKSILLDYGYETP